MEYGAISSKDLEIKSQGSFDCAIYFKNQHSWDGSAKIVWAPEYPNQTIRFPYFGNGTVVVEDKEYYLKASDHFAFYNPAATSGELSLKVVSNGGGAGTTLTTYADRLGVVSLATGTTATGRTCLHTQTNTIQFLVSPMLVDITAKLVTLPTTAEAFDLYLGFGDANSGSPTDGAYFFCSPTSPNWQVQTRIAGVLATKDTGVAVDTNWHLFSVRIEQHPTRADFFIDNIKVGDHPENATPQGTNQETAIQCLIQKTAGLTSRAVHIDRIFYGAYF